MLDFDPRDFDSGDKERRGNGPSRGSGGGQTTPIAMTTGTSTRTPTRGRDDDGARTLGRGPGNERQGADEHGRDGDCNPRCEPPLCLSKMTPDLRAELPRTRSLRRGSSHRTQVGSAGSCGSLLKLARF